MRRQKERCEVPGCKRVVWGIGTQLYCLQCTQEIFSERLDRHVLFNRKTGVDYVSGKTVQELYSGLRRGK